MCSSYSVTCSGSINLYICASARARAPTHTDIYTHSTVHNQLYSIDLLDSQYIYQYMQMAELMHEKL